MPMYCYSGVNPAGFRIRGEMVAASVEAAERFLADINVLPIECRQLKQKPLRIGYLFNWSKPLISLLELQRLTQDIALLLKSGLPLTQALQQTQRSSNNARVVEFTRQLHQSIAEGSSFAAALRQFPAVVPIRYWRVVEVAEVSGELGGELSKLAHDLEAQRIFRQRIRGAVAYPLLVLTLLVGLIAFLVSVVIPSLGDFMRELGQVMPWHTALLVSVCDSIRQRGLYVLAAIAVCIVAMALLRVGSPRFRLLTDRYLLSLPVVGSLTREWFVVRYSRDLASLIRSGIDLLDALVMLEATSNNRFLYLNTRVVRQQVADGIALAGGMRSTGLFAADYLQLLSLAEVSGHYADALEQIDSVSDARLTRRLDVIERSVGPLMMLVTGLLILWIILSVIAPIYSSAITAGGLL